MTNNNTSSYKELQKPLTSTTEALEWFFSESQSKQIKALKYLGNSMPKLETLRLCFWCIQTNNTLIKDAVIDILHKKFLLKELIRFQNKDNNAFFDIRTIETVLLKLALKNSPEQTKIIEYIFYRIDTSSYRTVDFNLNQGSQIIRKETITTLINLLASCENNKLTLKWINIINIALFSKENTFYWIENRHEYQEIASKIKPLLVAIIPLANDEKLNRAAANLLDKIEQTLLPMPYRGGKTETTMLSAIETSEVTFTDFNSQYPKNPAINKFLTSKRKKHVQFLYTTPNID